MKHPLHRILVWILCVLLGWMGARLLSSVPVKSATAIPSSTGTSNFSSDAPASSPAGARTNGLATSGVQRVFQPEHSAIALLSSRSRPQRDELLGILSNTVPALTNLAEARSVALEILSAPQLQLQAHDANALPFSPKRTWDPTLRRHIEIIPSGKVHATSLLRAGNPEDELHLEHPTDAAAVEVLPDGGSTNAVLAIRYANRDVIVWNVELSAVLARFTNVPPSQSVRLSADGSTAVLIRAATGTVEWRKFKNGQATFGVLPLTNISGAVPSPNGQWIATWTSPHSPIHVLQIQQGGLIGSLPFVHIHDQLQWSPDGLWIGVSGPDGFTSVWQASTLQLISIFRQADAKGSVWSFVPGRPEIVALDSAGTLTRHPLLTKSAALPIALETHSFKISPDGTSLVLFRQEGRIADRYRIDWTPNWISLIQDPPVDDASTHSVAWNSTGSLLGVSSANGLGIYHVGSGVAELIATNQPILRVQSLRGGTVFSMTTRRGVSTFKLAGEGDRRIAPTIQLLGEFPSEALGISASLDGTIYALRYSDRIAFHSDGNRTLEVRTPRTVDEIEMTADGEWLAATPGSGGVLVLSTRTGRTIWNSPERSRCEVRFSPDSRFLAVGTGREYSLWSVEGFSLLWKVARGTQRDCRAALDFSPDGKWIACAGGVDDLRVMAVSNGTELFRLAVGPAGPVTEVRFSPNQLRLCALQAGGVIRVWDFEWIQSSLLQMGLGLDKY